MKNVLSTPSIVARLNDAFRSTLLGGRVTMTAGVAALPDATKANALSAVRRFSAFCESNDPHGEHDFGSFEIDGTQFFWKIDYYDMSLQSGSDDPANPDVTTRILTIMLREEY